MIRNTFVASVMSFAIASSASADLIGVTPGTPLFDYDSGGTATYDANTGEITVNATPTFFTETDGSSPASIFNLGTAPSVTMTLSVDNSCELVGSGSLTVMADVDTSVPADFIPEATGTVLTGDAVEVGLSPASNSSLIEIDARFAITGGTLVDNGTYSLGSEVGVTLISEAAADFLGNCANSWNGAAKGQIGAIESEPPEEVCFDVKKVKIIDGKKHYKKWGWWGKSKSKIDVQLRTSCPTDFDPSQSFISTMVDGETFDFPVGSFTEKHDGSYRAWIGGHPSVYAKLDCDKGKFSMNVSRADTSQIDNSDGVDVKLVLGDSVSEKNVTLNESNHRYHWRGHRNVAYYHNPNPVDCSVEVDDTPVHKCKIRHKHSGKIFTFSKSKGHKGHKFFVHDAESGHYKEFDDSNMNCGEGDSNFEVVSIDHEDDSKSCVTTSESDEADDTEDE